MQFYKFPFCSHPCDENQIVADADRVLLEHL